MNTAKTLLALALVGSAGCSGILSTKWHRTTLATSTLAIACDYGMTRWMATHYDSGYRELNPLMGERPTAAKVDAVFAVSLILNAAIYPLLPSWAKSEWYTTATVAEAANVAIFTPGSHVCGL